MPAPSTSEEFLGLVRRSGLLPHLDAYLSQPTSPAPSPTPQDLAGALVRDGLLTDFQANQLLEGRSRGFTLGRYLILDRLGATRMSTVFLCQDQTLGRLVAVKVLSHARAANEDLLKRFYREARAAASLRHEHIVRAYDVEEAERGHLLVMEYVDGVSLEALVTGHGPLAPLRAAHYVRQAALGLRAAHEAGIVHRDVKPGNILVDRGGTVKVLDLGLALLADEEVQLTCSVLGSVDYLAPEQGVDSHAVDARADIYSLGATFWFLLTGAPPFTGATVMDRARAHRSQALRPIRSVRPEVPAGLEAILMRMLAREPQDRHPTAAAVVEALAPWTKQKVDPPPEREMPTVRRALRRAAAPPAGPVDPPPGSTPLPERPLPAWRRWLRYVQGRLWRGPTR
jgi:serine/threonine protein kinase